MRIFFFSLFCIFVCSVALVGQTRQPRQLDEFSILACGDMMGRLDVLLAEWRNDKSEQIVVIFYGPRFRKSTEQRKGGTKVTVLRHAHPDDGKNWAKGIPKYLLARYEEAWKENPALLKQRIRLLDGGYREDVRAELWLVPPGAEEPKPQATITRADISFGAKVPRRVPDYYNCYGGR